MSKQQYQEVTLHEREWLTLRLPGGRTVRIQVVKKQREKIRLGVLAPASVPVDRAEVHESKQTS